MQIFEIIQNYIHEYQCRKPELRLSVTKNTGASNARSKAEIFAKTGTLESLQNCIYERLRETPELCLADIKKEDVNDDGGKANGLRITAGRPLPKTASKYAAGPTFSEVELRVEVSRSDPIAANAPSLLSAAETVSKSLHNWTLPLACGYGRLSLAPQYPWISKDGKISIILNAQSVLQ